MIDVERTAESFVAQNAVPILYDLKKRRWLLREPDGWRPDERGAVWEAIRDYLRTAVPLGEPERGTMRLVANVERLARQVAKA